VRAGRKELDADAGASFGGVAQIDHTAFLLFIGYGIYEDEFRAQPKRLLKVDQATVSVDDDCLAIFPKLVPLDVSARRPDGDPREDSGAAPFASKLWLWHR
jgi:hypothetical protein